MKPANPPAQKTSAAKVKVHNQALMYHSQHLVPSSLA